MFSRPRRACFERSQTAALLFDNRIRTTTCQTDSGPKWNKTERASRSSRPITIIEPAHLCHIRDPGYMRSLIARTNLSAFGLCFVPQCLRAWARLQLAEVRAFQRNSRTSSPDRSLTICPARLYRRRRYIAHNLRTFPPVTHRSCTHTRHPASPRHSPAGRCP